MHAIARVWMACRVRLGPRHFAGRRTPAPAQQRPMPPRSPRSKRRPWPGRFHYLPVPLEVTGRPRRFRHDAAGRWLPTCRVLPSNAGIPNITATDGWMRPSKSPSRTRPQPCRHAGGRHVRTMRAGSQRRAVAQLHGMPTEPEFLARTDPLANLQGTSVGVGYSGEDRPAQFNHVLSVLFSFRASFQDLNVGSV